MFVALFVSRARLGLLLQHLRDATALHLLFLILPSGIPVLSPMFSSFLCLPQMTYETF